jgi:membrane protein implicated in regulation of membrane protease activity
MSRKDTENPLLLTICLIGCFLAVGFTIVAVNVGEGFAIPVGITAFVAAAVILRGPLGKALARRIEGRQEPGDNEALLQAMEELRGQMAELEERVDFAERVMAQQREPDRLHQ